MPHTATFHIELPLEDLSKFEKLLEDAGVNFSSVANMVYIPSQSDPLDRVFTGADAQNAIDKVNGYLQHQDGPVIGRLFDEMPPETRRDFLKFLSLHVSWSDSYQEADEVYIPALEQLLRQHRA